jgi:negative regulator of replication initiation
MRVYACNNCFMKNLNISIDDAIFAEIEKRTTPDFDHSDVIQKLLIKALQPSMPSSPKLGSPAIPSVRNSIVSFVQSPEYKVLSGINKYLAVLGWLHKHKPNEFEKVENFRRGNRVYFGKSQRQVEESGEGISAKLIPGSSIWTLATLDNRAKRGLLADVLQLCNYQTGEINVVVETIPDSGRHRRENIFKLFSLNS